MRRIILWTLCMLCLTALATAFAASGKGSQPDVGNASDPLLGVPVSGLHIGELPPPVKNPYAGDKSAVQQGHNLFEAMNCSGCHAPGGGGGMGPPLSDNVWIYGGKPANIYLSIMQGRPNGMPEWGSALPPQAIWSLVTYIETLSEKSNPYKVQTKLNVK